MTHKRDSHSDGRISARYGWAKFKLNQENTYPKLSSPQRQILPASSKLPKNFQPVGVSKHSLPLAAATLSTAPLVGMLRAYPLTGFFWK